MKKCRRVAWMKMSVMVGIIGIIMLGAPGSFAQNSGNIPGGVNGLFYGDGDYGRYTLLSEDPGLGYMYGLLNGTTLQIAFIADPNMNDNVFDSVVDGSGDTNGKSKKDKGGDKTASEYMSSVGWGENRSAKKLYDSEKLIDITLSCGNKSWTWTQSYLCKPKEYEAGLADPFEGPLSTLRSLIEFQPAGTTNYAFGDCGRDSGTTPSGYTAASSLAWNLNNTTWDDPSMSSHAEAWKSPFDADLNMPNQYPYFDTINQWEWPMVYEMGFDISACGDNPVSIRADSIHNSPSKGGDDAEFPSWTNVTEVITQGELTCGTADVDDGNHSEWDLSEDFFAEMHEAGDPGKELLSNLYLRYDVSTVTMYALVLREGNWEPDASADDAWVKIYDLGQSPLVDGNSSDFQWLYDGSTLIGYEAAFALPEGIYAEVEAHISVDGGRTSSTGKENKGGYISLDVDCPEPPTPESGSITIFKYNDLNKNGQRDASEPGLEGWEFTATDSDGNQVSGTTDADGKLSFDDLLLGEVYDVCETLQDGWTNSTPLCQTVTADAGGGSVAQGSGGGSTTSNVVESGTIPGGVNGLFYGDGDYERYTLLSEDPGLGYMYGMQDGTRLQVAFVADPNMNDNVFDSVVDGSGETNGKSKKDKGGDKTASEYMSSVGWGENRSAKKLYDSEKLIDITLSCGNKSWTWTQSYLCKPKEYDAGLADPFEGPLAALRSLIEFQPAGTTNYAFGDCGRDSGTTPAGYTAASSLAWNLNNTTWDDQSMSSHAEAWKSPFDPDLNTPNQYPYFDTINRWEWPMVYEMGFDISACGDNPVSIKADSIHNSPSKGGDDAEFPSWTNVTEVIEEAVEPVMFGNYQIVVYKLGDFIWEDLNKDGIQDANEPGIEGVELELYAADGNTVLAAATTDSTGAYLFENLPDGDYVVKINAGNFNAGGALEGYSYSPQDQSSNDATDSDFDSSIGKASGTINGADNLTIDGGFFLPLSSIGDRVWFDDNGDGVQDDGEPGVESVTVTLYTCDDTFVEETITDADGNYLFENLAPGEYYVEFSNLPSGYVFTVQGPNGTSDSIDSDADSDQTSPAYGQTECTTLESGEDDLTWDAGIVKGLEVFKYQRLDDSDEWTFDPLENVKIGDTFSYQISVENVFYAPDLNLQISDALSDLIDFEEGSVLVEKVGSGGTGTATQLAEQYYSFDYIDHELSLDVSSEFYDTLLFDDILRFSFGATANDTFGFGDVITNQAEVTLTGKKPIKSNIVEIYPVPEAATVFLVGLGLLGMVGLGRKRMKK